MAKEPLETVAILVSAASPIRMMEPFPKFFSILRKAFSNAASRWSAKLLSSFVAIHINYDNRLFVKHKHFIEQKFELFFKFI